MSDKNTNIKERILQVIDLQGLKKVNFLPQIGMTYDAFRGKALETSLNSDAIVKFLALFPEINPNWLLTGEGSMLKAGYTHSGEVSEPETAYGSIDYNKLADIVLEKMADKLKK